MAKLHELLAAEKTPTAAWNSLYEETLKKFKAQSHFFEGHSKWLSMIEDTPANKTVEDSAREEKPVTTTVYETLEYALDIYARSEDIQFQKNSTNRRATGDVEFEGVVILKGIPVDELLGLEARLMRLRLLFAEIPTLDATKDWENSPQIGEHIYQTRHPEETTKTEKQIIPVQLSPATDKHPAQVQAVTKDIVVGKFTTIRRSGSATAFQKAEALKRIDTLLMEVKRARMRANETEADTDKIAASIVKILLEPLK